LNTPPPNPHPSGPVKSSFLSVVVVKGKNINLRVVEVVDAEFILELRLDEGLNKHLSYVENDVIKQRNWIKNIKY
jgi:hypothetical protein